MVLFKYHCKDNKKGNIIILFSIRNNPNTSKLDKPINTTILYTIFVPLSRIPFVILLFSSYILLHPLYRYFNLITFFPSIHHRVWQTFHVQISIKSQIHQFFQKKSPALQLVFLPQILLLSVTFSIVMHMKISKQSQR